MANLRVNSAIAEEIVSRTGRVTGGASCVYLGNGVVTSTKHGGAGDFVGHNGHRRRINSAPWTSSGQDDILFFSISPGDNRRDSERINREAPISLTRPFSKMEVLVFGRETGKFVRCVVATKKDTNELVAVWSGEECPVSPGDSGSGIWHLDMDGKLSLVGVLLSYSYVSHIPTSLKGGVLYFVPIANFADELSVPVRAYVYTEPVDTALVCGIVGIAVGLLISIALYLSRPSRTMAVAAMLFLFTGLSSAVAVILFHDGGRTFLTSVGSP